MVRLCLMTASLLLLSFTLAFGQATAAPQNPTGSATAAQSSDPNAVHGLIPVQLSKSLDSKKMKQGDKVEARTVVALNGPSGMLIPSDSKVIGHVTEASARSKGDAQSSLGIVFDKIELSTGKELPIKATLQAVGPNPKALAGPDTGAAGSGTLAKQDGGNYATTPNPGWGPGTYPGENPADKKVGTVLNAHSTGVVGIKNLELQNNSVLVTGNKEVKLDMGSQILIKAE